MIRILIYLGMQSRSWMNQIINKDNYVLFRLSIRSKKESSEKEKNHRWTNRKKSLTLIYIFVFFSQTDKPTDQVSPTLIYTV